MDLADHLAADDVDDSMDIDFTGFDDFMALTASQVYQVVEETATDIGVTIGSKSISHNSHVGQVLIQLGRNLTHASVEDHFIGSLQPFEGVYDNVLKDYVTPFGYDSFELADAVEEHQNMDSKRRAKKTTVCTCQPGADGSKCSVFGIHTTCDTQNEQEECREECRCDNQDFKKKKFCPDFQVKETG